MRRTRKLWTELRDNLYLSAAYGFENDRTITTMFQISSGVARPASADICPWPLEMM